MTLGAVALIMTGWTRESENFWSHPDHGEELMTYEDAIRIHLDEHGIQSPF